MTSVQQQLYSELIQKSKKIWEQRRNTGDEAEEDECFGKVIRNALMQMRKVANHPMLCRVVYSDQVLHTIVQRVQETEDNYDAADAAEFLERLQDSSDLQVYEFLRERSLTEFYENEEDLLIKNSAKMKALVALLEKCAQKDRKVLLFSQMTKLLDILEHVLRFTKHKYLRLDGQTTVSERQKLVDKFNNSDKYDVFLLSTRAGGEGINLTRANVVVFYDISFNPQVERQAEDRCHRLGQTKDVFIYKLIVTDTIDEYILGMANQKKVLEGLVLRDDGNDETTTSNNSENSVPDIQAMKLKDIMTFISTVSEKA